MGRFAPHPVTLRQLQYAVAVAEHRSFRRAAEACAVAQPSLSAQVSQLEDALGVRLFERLARGLVVTEAGAHVLDRARRTLLEADDLVATAARGLVPFSGVLRIGVIPTIAPYLLPELAPVLRTAFPLLRLLWIEEKTEHLLVGLRSGELDAGILALPAEVSGLHSENVARDPFLLAVPAGHALARGKGPAKLEDLEGEIVLLLDDGHCFREQALAVCDRAGAEEASVRATSLSTLAQMVAGGTGITLLPELAVATENRAGALVTRAFGPRGPSRTLALTWRPTSHAVETLRALTRSISAAIASRHP
ncbi:MAG: transcriptional regulator, LysR family [Labilithrix sp.]|nr:transcriptional regulator, LysR family [Labilithrix sp.]